MRVPYSFALRDQNWLVYQHDKEINASLPLNLLPAPACHFARFPLTHDDYGALFDQLHARHHEKARVKIQLAPANLDWCLDKALEMLADYSVLRRADAHAPRRDRLPEGRCSPARQHRIGLP